MRGNMTGTRADLTALFRASADYEREIAFLRDELAKEKARTQTVSERVHNAADHLSMCKVTAGSQVRVLWPRIDKAALELVAALMLIDAELPDEAIDLTEATSILNSDGAIAWACRKLN